MKAAIIVACGRGYIIGNNGKLPWHLSADLAYFKKLTEGKTVVMGRLTWESLPIKPLPGRRNIVMSRQRGFNLEGAEVIDSIERLDKLLDRDEECMIIGGEEIYQQFLPLAEKIYLTRVNTDIAGDAHFPSLDDNEWMSVRQGGHRADENNDYDMDFIIMRRKACN